MYSKSKYLHILLCRLFYSKVLKWAVMKLYVIFVNSFAVKSYFYKFKLFEVCWDPQNFKDNFHLVALTNQCIVSFNYRIYWTFSVHWCMYWLLFCQISSLIEFESIGSSLIRYDQFWDNYIANAAHKECFHFCHFSLNKIRWISHLLSNHTRFIFLKYALDKKYKQSYTH